MRGAKTYSAENVEKGAFSVFSMLAAALMMVIVGAMFSLAVRHHMISQLAASNVAYKGKADDMVLTTALELEGKLPIGRSVDQAILDTVEEDGVRYKRAYNYQRNASCLYHMGAAEQLFTVVVAVEQKDARERWLPRVRSVGVFRVDDGSVQLDHWEP